MSQRPELFNIYAFETKPPITEEELVEVENQIGVQFPAILRNIYTQVCSEVNFLWRLIDEKAGALGYNPDSMPLIHGNINLLPPKKIVQEITQIHAGYADYPKQREIVQGFVPIIIDDAAGDMYCLNYKYIPPAVSVLLHDVYPDGEAIATNFEAFFDEWSQTGFIAWIDSIFYDGLDLDNEDLRPIIKYLSE